MDVSVVEGSCLCGKVRFSLQPPFETMRHCHCGRCRKGTGTGHATNLLVGMDQISWLSGEDLISRFELSDAKSFGKWFCRCCGSPLPRLSRSGYVVVPSGSLDTDPGISPSSRIFWDSRVRWSCEGDGLPTHSGYPES
ncbi:GFA family protein [Gynuella sp.]|uniref:GFA family protein n=1 Tax=Gynuella sp. TaxID=2969146 RepID=UPI003D1289D5